MVRSKNIQDFIVSDHKPLSREEHGTKNLYLAYQYLKNQLDSISKEDNKFDYIGLLHMNLITDTHRILMKNIIPTRGYFSSSLRSSYWSNRINYYPLFTNCIYVSNAVSIIIDNYNDALENIIKKCQSRTEFEEGFLECLTKFIFCFLTIHPFGDGNGRLARLIYSYCLSAIRPFPRITGDKREDFINALRKDMDSGVSLIDAEPIIIDSLAKSNEYVASLMSINPQNLRSIIVI